MLRDKPDLVVVATAGSQISKVFRGGDLSVSVERGGHELEIEAALVTPNGGRNPHRDAGTYQ